MADAVGSIIFIVIFYYVFKFIWKNVTTVSYNGLEGFFRSWGNQAFWAFMITCFIVTIVGLALKWLIDALTPSGDFDLFDLIALGGGALFLYSFISESDSAGSQSNASLFVKKTFMDNYNRNVRELRRAEGLDALNDTPCTDDALTLPEDFLTRNSGYEYTEIIQFPNVSLSHSDLETPIEIFLFLQLESTTSVNQLETLIAKITFTAAIEAVAPGKSREIERALSSIDSNGSFCLPPYSYEEQKKFEGEYDKDGVHYMLSRGDSLLTLSLFYFG